MTAGKLAAAGLLGEALAGISQSRRHVDPERPDLSADFDESDDAITATITVPTGDRFEITVRWLGDESP